MFTTEGHLGLRADMQMRPCEYRTIDSANVSQYLLQVQLNTEKACEHMMLHDKVREAMSDSLDTLLPIEERSPP